jgi:hypothetical protein
LTFIVHVLFVVIFNMPGRRIPRARRVAATRLTDQRPFILPRNWTPRTTDTPFKHRGLTSLPSWVYVYGHPRCIQSLKAVPKTRKRASFWERRASLFVRSLSSPQQPGDGRIHRPPRWNTLYETVGEFCKLAMDIPSKRRELPGLKRSRKRVLCFFLFGADWPWAGDKSSVP